MYEWFNTVFCFIGDWLEQVCVQKGLPLGSQWSAINGIGFLDAVILLSSTSTTVHINLAFFLQIPRI